MRTLLAAPLAALLLTLHVHASEEAPRPASHAHPSDPRTGHSHGGSTHEGSPESSPSKQEKTGTREGPPEKDARPPAREPRRDDSPDSGHSQHGHHSTATVGPEASDILSRTLDSDGSHPGQHSPTTMSPNLLSLPSDSEASHPGHHSSTTVSPEAPDILSLPMARDASGTAWQPDATPHAGTHLSAGRWGLMFHEQLFGGYVAQASKRGAHRFAGTGWLMLMAQRPLGEDDRLGLRLMLSPEPLTAGGEGYPLLFQSGETYAGQRLHDRQHPHDLFMEAAVTYTRALAPGWGFQLYAAPVGEPALGPVAAPHRASAAADPLAAIGHHWLDSSHISFGVLTAALLTPTAKLELSWFNGREPDENRWDFDLRVPDSYAARLTTNPTPGVSAQVSYGYMPSHDPLEPDEPLHRLTASVMYHRSVGSAGHWATTAAFGRNVGEHSGDTNAFLLETNLDLDGRNVLFGRAEYVEKNDHDLVLPESFHGSTFDTVGLSLGYLRNLGTWGDFVPGLGARVSVNPVPEGLGGVYGSALPVGGMVYLRLASAPSRH